MKQKYFLIALVTFNMVSLQAFADAGAIPEITFNGVRWGASAADIKASRSAPPKREVVNGPMTYLVYPDTLAGENISLVYNIIGNKLFEVSKTFESKGRSCKALLEKFNEVIAELTAEYGPPASAPGIADACNSVREWEVGDTSVLASLTTNTGRSDLAVVYDSTATGKLAERVIITPAGK